MARTQVYKDGDGDWRWRRIADNGNTIATSGEGYKNKRHAVEMAASNFPDDTRDWSLTVDPEPLLDDGDDDDTNDG